MRQLVLWIGRDCNQEYENMSDACFRREEAQLAQQIIGQYPAKEFNRTRLILMVMVKAAVVVVIWRLSGYVVAAPVHDRRCRTLPTADMCFATCA